jgi:hypothetical protein
MSGYYGTEMQQRLQARAEENADFIRTTAGACQAGRTMGCDDPDRFGWERILHFVNRDGACGFRLIALARMEALRSRMAEQNLRLDTWEVFLADRTTALPAAEAILDRGLPDGLTDLDRPTDPDGAYISRIQALMGSAGVFPFSGSLLVGALGPATTVAVGDASGRIVAAAHGYMPHNEHSRWRHYAWGGLVAVDETERGRRLGSYINARMVVSVFRDLGATHIYELVAGSNAPSRRMVEACGLRLEPALVCGVGTPNDKARLTK